jgi:hypothetical protein
MLSKALSLLAISLLSAGFSPPRTYKYVVIIDTLRRIDSSEKLYLLPASDSLRIDARNHAESESIHYHGKLEPGPYNPLVHNILLNEGIRLNPSRLDNVLCCEKTSAELLRQQKGDSLLAKYRVGAENFNKFFYDNRASYKITGRKFSSGEAVITIYAAKIEANFCLCNIAYDSKSVYLPEAHLPMHASIMPLSEKEKTELKFFFDTLVKKVEND